MKRTFWAAAVAALAFYGVVTPADAAKKSAPRSGLAAIQFECFKKYGGFYDTETKRWIIRGEDLHMQSWIEAIQNCVAQKTGRRQAPFMREEREYY